MPAAARKGDRCVPHCSPFNISEGSASVFINGQAAARKGDAVDIHANPTKKCRPHTPKINQGSSTVFINGISAATVGSSIASCTSVSGGSPNVFIS